MNLDDAIKTHVDWKMKLKTFLAKPDGSLDPAVVGSDGACVLGKWLRGEGKIHAGMPEFQALLAEHAKFHKAAAQVVIKARAGQNMTEEVALGAKSEFATTSSRVVALIMDLKRKLG
ncbi:MAG: CZB domain-containing protein [Polyangia bacterium]|jgi:hypothetical protein